MNSSIIVFIIEMNSSIIEMNSSIIEMNSSSLKWIVVLLTSSLNCSIIDFNWNE